MPAQVCKSRDSSAYDLYTITYDFAWDSKKLKNMHSYLTFSFGWFLHMDYRWFCLPFKSCKETKKSRNEKKNQLSLLTSFLETKSLFSSTSVVGWRLKRNIFFIKIIKIHYFLVGKKYESSILKAHFLD